MSVIISQVQSLSESHFFSNSSATEDAILADIQVEEQYSATSVLALRRGGRGRQEADQISLADKFSLPSNNPADGQIMPRFEPMLGTQHAHDESQVHSDVLTHPPSSSPLHLPPSLHGGHAGVNSDPSRLPGRPHLPSSLLPLSSAPQVSRVAGSTPSSPAPSSGTPVAGSATLLPSPSSHSPIPHPAHHLTHRHLPHSLNAPLPSFSALSPSLQQNASLHNVASQPPTIFSSNLFQPQSTQGGMTQLMQGLHNIHNVLNPHQSTTAPFSNPLTSMAGSLPVHSTSLPLLPTLPSMYPYNPYGGIPPMSVLSAPPVSSVSGPARIGGASFAAPSLMAGYPSYVPPGAMYTSNQINTTTFSR